MPFVYKAIPCTCRYPTCKMWEVDGIASEAKFNKRQAEAVAAALNALLEDDGDRDNPSGLRRPLPSEVIQDRMMK